MFNPKSKLTAPKVNFLAMNIWEDADDQELDAWIFADESTYEADLVDEDLEWDAVEAEWDREDELDTLCERFYI